MEISPIIFSHFSRYDINKHRDVGGTFILLRRDKFCRGLIGKLEQQRPHNRLRPIREEIIKKILTKLILKCISD
jgi:hypothetical protein